MINGLNHITIAVTEIERSLDFYVNQIGMTPHVKWDGGAYLTLDNVWFCLSVDNVSPSQDYSHLAFSISEDDFESFLEMSRENKIIEWKQNSSEGKSLYILDPDGNKLEVHSGNLQTRLNELKVRPYPGLEWF